MGVVIIPHPHPMDPYIPPFRPAPIMRVHVCHRDIEDVAFLRAFLDTGADVTTLAPWGPFVIENQIARLLPQDSIRVGDIEVPAYDLGFSFARNIGFTRITLWNISQIHSYIQGRKIY